MKHLKRDMSQIERSILEIGALVEQSIQRAISVISNPQPGVALSVIADDGRIDELEVELEEECLKVLALHQPVASDLRFIVSVIKVNSTLERMGDHACNVARGAQDLGTLDPKLKAVNIVPIAEMAIVMVRNSLNSLVQLDVNLARQVLSQDDEVDDQKRAIKQQIIRLLDAGVESSQDAINLLLVSRNLERIADLATNIAEDVIFMVEGDIIRHQHTTQTSAG